MKIMQAYKKLGGFPLVLCSLAAMAGAASGAQLSDVLLGELARLKTTAGQPYVICKNQTYALCATATSFVYQEVAYAKCQVKRGDSISAPPLYYPPNTKVQKNICDYNAEGAGNGYMASTYSLPPSILKDNPAANQALYTCPGGSTAGYAQCDGGTCFTSTIGKSFPGVGQLKNDEIVCSCPITQASASSAPFGFQFVGPYPCQQEAFKFCSQNVQNGSIIPVGAPPGAGRYLTIQLTGKDSALNECFVN